MIPKREIQKGRKGGGRWSDARYSGNGSKGEKKHQERERVVIQDLSSQTVTAGLVLLARFKGYRIPRRFCDIATDLPRQRERSRQPPHGRTPYRCFIDVDERMLATLHFLINDSMQYFLTSRDFTTTFNLQLVYRIKYRKSSRERLRNFTSVFNLELA